MLMHETRKGRLFDEAAPERVQTEESEPFLLFFPSLAVFEVMGQIR